MEIGSEFEWNSVYDQIELKTFPDAVVSIEDWCFTFSGRTAIETILRNEQHIKKVLFPSYCCKSMMDPFLQRGIDIVFYTVDFINGLKVDIDISDDVDAVLWCNYFGYHQDIPNFAKFRARGGILIEDITHSMLSEEPFHVSVDYVVGSLRKWGPFICGGICRSLKNRFKEIPNQEVDFSFISRKIKAMKDKHRYLLGSPVHKSNFLNEYHETNEWLATNYSNRKIDNFSFELLRKMNFKDIRERRIKNSIILHEGLENVQGISFLFSKQDIDCPLFVPIIVDPEKRDLLRSFLCANEVYCPVHWPKPFDIMNSGLYDRELSLICDQRYNDVNMNRIVNLIKKFMTQN